MAANSVMIAVSPSLKGEPGAVRPIDTAPWMPSSAGSGVARIGPTPGEWVCGPTVRGSIAASRTATACCCRTARADVDWVSGMCCPCRSAQGLPSAAATCSEPGSAERTRAAASASVSRRAVLTSCCSAEGRVVGAGGVAAPSVGLPAPGGGSSGLGEQAEGRDSRSRGGREAQQEILVVEGEPAGGLLLDEIEVADRVSAGPDWGAEEGAQCGVRFGPPAGSRVRGQARHPERLSIVEQPVHQAAAAVGRACWWCGRGGLVLQEAQHLALVRHGECGAAGVQHLADQPRRRVSTSSPCIAPASWSPGASTAHDLPREVSSACAPSSNVATCSSTAARPACWPARPSGPRIPGRPRMLSASAAPAVMSGPTPAAGGDDGGRRGRGGGGRPLPMRIMASG